MNSTPDEILSIEPWHDEEDERPYSREFYKEHFVKDGERAPFRWEPAKGNDCIAASGPGFVPVESDLEDDAKQVEDQLRHLGHFRGPEYDE